MATPKEIIIYNGNKYDFEKIKEYYDIEFCERLHQTTEGDFETEQEFFEAYIKADPTFTDLFDYDIDPIEE